MEWRKAMFPLMEAEGGASGAEGTGGAAEGEKTFDDILTDKKYQAEFDRRIARSLETAKSKWQGEQETRLAEEKRLSKLSAEQKAEEELKTSNAKVAALEAEKKSILLKQDTVSALADKKLPAAFADFLVAENTEATNGRIEGFEKAFREAVEAAVNERLKGKPPAGGSAENTDPFLTGFNS